MVISECRMWNEQGPIVAITISANAHTIAGATAITGAGVGGSATAVAGAPGRLLLDVGAKLELLRVIHLF